MNGIACGPILQFLRRPAKIFQDLAIKKFDLACRTHGTHEPWNGVDDMAKIDFARTQGFLGALPLFNVSGNTIPANHATTGIPKRLGNGTKPAIDVIEPAHTLFYVTRLTGFDGMQPCLFRSLDILWMEDVSPSKTHQVLLAFAGVVHDAPI